MRLVIVLCIGIMRQEISSTLRFQWEECSCLGVSYAIYMLWQESLFLSAGTWLRLFYRRISQFGSQFIVKHSYHCRGKRSNQLIVRRRAFCYRAFSCANWLRSHCTFGMVFIEVSASSKAFTSKRLLRKGKVKVGARKASPWYRGHL